MGYEVIVTGKLKFRDVEAFKKEFEKIAQHRKSEIGMHGDFDYFFTKMWGEHLENFDSEIDENGEVELHREGKLWWDENKVAKFISKFASGIIEYKGEDGNKWRYVINKDKTFKRQASKNVYID